MRTYQKGGVSLQHQITKKGKRKKMNTYLVIFNLEGREQKIFINAGSESQAQRIFERDYMFDQIISIEEQQ